MTRCVSPAISMFKYLSLITIFLYLSISWFPPVAEAVEKSGETKVTANIPAAASLRVFGYTAPNTIVQAEGYRVFAQVASDKDGYFLIEELPISSQAQEICLATIDSERRVGFPLCIGVPTTATVSADIGPLLLSPTISLSKGTIWQNQMLSAEGVTIPNSKVAFSFFEVAKVTLGQKLTNVFSHILTPQAEAASLPQVLTTSNKKGAFSISLPTFKAKGYRLFVKTFYQESPTPKSQTLSYNVGSSEEYFKRYILPKLLLALIILVVSSWLVLQEVKTKKIRIYLAYFNEKKLLPSAVRTHLRLRRLWYNLRQYWQSHRK